jgi:hypothetical protein
MRHAAVGAFGMMAAGILIAASMNSCGVGTGVGSVTGDLYVTDCWSGKYDLQPNFFAATPDPDSDTLTIRVQNGSDYINFSDGIDILVTNVSATRSAIETNGPQQLSVSLPPAVVPPGVPVTPTPTPATVQLALYLQQTCRPETPGLYAMDLVTTDVPSEGGILCSATTVASASMCDSGAAPAATGSSTITFNHLFDASLAEGGDPGALTADQRLIDATFDVLLADPRDECPGGLGPPAPCRGHLTGSFRFYFERGTPAQAFP